MEFLRDVQAGDTVHVRAGSMYVNTHSVTVTKVTPTQIVCGGSRYRRSDGRPIGASSWAGQLISAADAAEIEAEIRLLRTQNEWAEKMASRWRLNQESIEALRALVDHGEAILREHGRWEDARAEGRAP